MDADAGRLTSAESSAASASVSPGNAGDGSETGAGSFGRFGEDATGAPGNGRGTALDEAQAASVSAKRQGSRTRVRFITFYVSAQRPEEYRPLSRLL